MSSPPKTDAAGPGPQLAARGCTSLTQGPAATQTSTPTTWATRPAAVYLLVAGLACAAYLNTLGNDFVYDDVVLVKRNPRIRSLANLRRIWLTDWWYAPPEQSEERHRDRLYRPLVMQSFALNYAVSGLNTWSYHLFNIAGHAATCVIIVALTRRLSCDPRVAAWTGLLFAVLPVHTESVANIVGRADVLGAFFCALGLLCLTKELAAGPTGWRLPWRGAALLCVPLGLLSKEQAICLPALFLLIEWYLRRHRRTGDPTLAPGKPLSFLLRRFASFYLWVVLGVAGYLLLRYVCLEYHLVRDVAPAAMDNPLSEATPAQRFWTPFKILAQYVLVSVWPANLCCDYSYNALPLAGSPADPKVLLGLALVAAAVYASIRSAKGSGTVLFLILFFALAYALVSNSFLVIGTIMGERLFYLPSFPLCWLIVIALGDAHAWLVRRRHLAGSGLRLAPALAYAALLVLTLRTPLRCSDWRGPETLFTTDLQIYPHSARLQLFVARGHIRRKEYDLALEHLEKSLAIYPEYSNAQANLALIYALAGDWVTAKKYYGLARQLLWENPQMQLQYEQFRQLYEEGVKFPEKQLQALLDEAAEQPDHLELHLRLAELQAGLGHYRDAIATLRSLVGRGFEQRQVRFELATLLIVDEQYDQAEVILEELLAADESDWQSHSQLAILLAYSDLKASLGHARRAVELAPLLFEPRMNLVQALLINRRYEDAMQELRTLHRMLPPDEPARLLVERQIGIVEDRL